jgi:TRAP-type uncharacterized transport system fused permease subunit
LVEYGLPPLASHLFVFYFGLASFITPPVCVEAFLAASIAKAPMMKTGFQSSRLGIVVYLVPFMFATNTTLLMMGHPLRIVLAAITAIVGILALSAAVSGYLLSKLNWMSRIALVITGVMLMIPGWPTDILGTLILLGMVLFQWRNLSQIRRTAMG